ncbi:Iaa10p [Stylosanthes scabra]|uniref:Auxin-induced protein n=1 Tax=Stylosanthes scabra TaxID=79078 RepID=A0ABU6WB86_9FABA|nr:Iaa10p [Stylosanthes scabra]
MQGVTIIPTSGGGGESTMSSTLSKEDTNLVLSSEDSSCPEDSELLELGLGLGLSHKPAPKSHTHHHHHNHHHARILTAKDFPSSASASSSSSSSSSPASSLSRANNNTTITSGTKRTADSVAAAANGPSQVVGWPPLGIHRAKSINSKSPATEVFNLSSGKSKSGKTDVLRKSADKTDGNNDNIDTNEKRNIRSSLFVKVNMDGIAIGRKVDLGVHTSYETLAQTLEDMFRESTAAITFNGSNGEDYGILVGGDQHSKYLDGSSKFVLTYEDKDGDWMLVGDVPWEMFINSVRRLRIMRTSEANGNGLAPILEEKNCRQKSKPI